MNDFIRNNICEKEIKDELIHLSLISFDSELLISRTGSKMINIFDWCIFINVSFIIIPTFFWYLSLSSDIIVVYFWKRDFFWLINRNGLLNFIFLKTDLREEVSRSMYWMNITILQYISYTKNSLRSYYSIYLALNDGLIFSL